MKKTSTIEFFTDRKREWRWRLKHGNGRILAASSEGFASRRNARRNWASTVTAANCAVPK